MNKSKLIQNSSGNFILNDEDLKILNEQQNSNSKNKSYSDINFNTERNNSSNFYSLFSNNQIYSSSKNPIDLKSISKNDNNNNIPSNKDNERRKYYIIDKNKTRNSYSNINIAKKFNFFNKNDNNIDFKKPLTNTYSNLDYTKFNSNKNSLSHVKSNSVSKYHYKINIDDNNVNNTINNSALNNILNSPEYLKLQKENDSLIQENISLKQELAETINQLNKIKSTEININYTNNNNDLRKQLIFLQEKLSIYENSLEKTKIQYEDQIKNYLSQISNCNNYLQIVYSFFNNIKERFFPNFDLGSCNFQNNNLTINNNNEFSLKFQEIEKLISNIFNELNYYKSNNQQLKNINKYDINNDYNNIINNLNNNSNIDKINSIKNLEQRIFMLEKEFKQNNIIDNNFIDKKNIEFKNDIISQKTRPKSSTKIYQNSSRVGKISIDKKKLGLNNKIHDKSLKNKIHTTDYGRNNFGTNKSTKKLNEKSRRKPSGINKNSNIKSIKK